MRYTDVYKTSWKEAYLAFLSDRHESIFLKIAPLALLIGTPEIVASNLLPVIGEFIDIGSVTLTAIVVLKTVRSVNKHRHPLTTTTKN